MIDLAVFTTFCSLLRFWTLFGEEKLACSNANAVVVMGDFNMQVDWENQVGTGPQEREFVECLRDGFLEQLVLEPTREKAILDLCNEPDLIKELEVKEPLGGSDHSMVRFNLHLEREKGRSEVSVLELNKGDYIREELAKDDWKDTLAGMTVEQQWQVFRGIIQKMQDQFIPKRKKGSKGSKGLPWLTRDVRDSIKIKEKTYVAKRSGKQEDWVMFKEQQKITKRTIRGEEMRYEGKQAKNMKEDSKSFFRYMKRKRLGKAQVEPLKTEKGEFIMGNKEMADELNSYFGSAFTKEDTNNLPDTVVARGSGVTEELKEIHIGQEMAGYTDGTEG
ncbi:uncharacterized protein LOC129702543 [Leucoraja erinacea]|uniref:uncharacterized protein LOC129702543 n=1 Tax=Leucoraja erinaceus TaxID=7782 RepID=UPI002454305F|nr:uncharacterized protein LOC129702543 [Leucoraja erinacea]XP_055500271.1 uncharacterized protein LOC129702543 [Leucoraja erinacea]